jgi:hypothetical protein
MAEGFRRKEPACRRFFKQAASLYPRPECPCEAAQTKAEWKSRKSAAYGTKRLERFSPVPPEVGLFIGPNR